MELNKLLTMNFIDKKPGEGLGFMFWDQVLGGCPSMWSETD